MDEEIMDALLKLYDWHIRLATLDADDYRYGYADAIGQCILDAGEVLGCHKWDVEKQDFVTGYKYEAYRRVMEYDTTANYWKKYPTPLADYFPADVIRKNGGKL